jgi:hypothetical protein
MFHTKTTTTDSNLSHDVDVIEHPADPIPLSVLALDLGEPPTGWASHLADRDIAVVIDDVGRRAVSRSDARALVTESHENELRLREVGERQEQAAVEADRVRRAALPKGLPWYELPDGVSAAQMWAAAEKDAHVDDAAAFGPAASCAASTTA